MIARAVGWLVWLVLRAYAFTRPHVRIEIDGGEIDRWFLTSRPESGHTGPSGWYLQHIHGPDSRPELHNHPWTWANSRVLRGWYGEDRRTRGLGAITYRRLCAGDRNYLNPETYHRISVVSVGGVWTLFHAGPKHGRGWGFR